MAGLFKRLVAVLERGLQRQDDIGDGDDGERQRGAEKTLDVRQQF